MKYYQPERLEKFIGRDYELGQLQEIDSTAEASIIYLYGRRRTGKTQLLEEFFYKHKILKFEGIQNIDKLSLAENIRLQFREALKRLAKYTENPLFLKTEINSWSEFFELLTPYLKKSGTVLYFEEIQWLACYSQLFFAELKPYWDDEWRHFKKFRLIICGSAPSFILRQLGRDSALYGRSSAQIHLKPFNPHESKLYLNKAGSEEALMAELLVGGIPPYLKKLSSKSVLLSLAAASFLPESYFQTEYQKIMVSLMSGKPIYRKILTILAKRRFATRDEIAQSVSISAGGDLSLILDDLELSGFISAYQPIQKNEQSKLIRYCISDPYIQFYTNFIKPVEQKINQGYYNDDPSKAINQAKLNQFLGYSFERWCRDNSVIIAKILGFDRIAFTAGAFFNRKSESLEHGSQIDLVFVRADKRIVVCEIKYGVSKYNSLAQEMDNKIELIKIAIPKYKNYTYEKVLICTNKDALPTSLKEKFDEVIGLKELFSSLAKRS
jgi:AAA+ ATPase superfamily predicted ATPase